MHCWASPSASRSCSRSRPVAVIRSLRSMAAGVSTGPPNCGSRGHGSVFSQSISVLRYTAISPRPAGPGGNRSRTSLSCSITLSKRACRPSRALSSALAWSVSIRWRRAISTCWNSFGSRSATANSSRPRAMVSAAACESSAVRPSRGGRQSAIRSARSSTVPRPSMSPGLLVLQQLSHRVELGMGEIDGGAGRCSHQAAQVVRAAKPLEPALGRTGERIRRPVHRQGDGRRAEPGPEQPREHYKRLPASSRAPGDRPDITGR